METWKFKIHLVGMALLLSFVILSSVRNIISEDSSTPLKILSLGAAVIAFYFLFQRDTYLPFLGYTAMPKSLIKEMIAPANSNVHATIHVNDVPDGTKIVYWGAKSSKVILPNPWDAYDQYQNAGVTEIRAGKAQIRFYCPAKYKIPTGQTLKRHIHYRIVYNEGIVGPVQTTYVDC